MHNVQQGIMLLVQTVAEVTNRIGMNNTRSSQALKVWLWRVCGVGGWDAWHWERTCHHACT